MAKHLVEVRGAHGTWEFPGCTEDEATFETHEAALAAIESLVETDPETWGDAAFRTRYEGPDGVINNERVR